MDDWNVSTITSIVSTAFAGIAVLVAYLMWRRDIRVRYEEDGRWKGKVDTILGGIDKRFSDLDERFANLEKQVSHLVHFLVGVFGRDVIKVESPIRLSDFGESISEDVSAHAWAERVSETVKTIVKDMDAYEIQVFCFEYVENNAEYSDEEQRTIRKIAYEQGVKAEDVRRVLAVELRDKLLEHVGLGTPEEPSEP